MTKKNRNPNTVLALITIFRNTFENEHNFKYLGFTCHEKQRKPYRDQEETKIWK